MTAFPKAKVWKSKKYLRFVASLECCIPQCNIDRATVIPHHTEGGGRRKRDDLTIPACFRHHAIYHKRSRKGFEYIFGVNIKDIIAATQALWLEAGNKAEWEQ